MRHVYWLRRWMALAVVMLALGLLAVSCGDSDSDEGGASATTDEGEGSGTTSGGAATTGGSATTSSEPLEIGIVNFDKSAIVANLSAEAARTSAEELGWDVSIIDAAGDIDKANSAIETFASQGVDAIISLVFPADALAAGLQAAQDAGVPVFSMGGGPGPGILVDINANLPEPLIDAMLEDLNGTTELLALTYTPGAPCLARENSLDEILASQSDINVTKQEITIPGQVESGERAAVGWLAAHPEGSADQLAVWACFDDPATGAIAAAQSAGRADILVYGYDGTEPALTAIQGGRMTATLWIDVPAAGERLVEEIAEAAAQGFAGEPETVDADAIVVTADNIEDFLVEHPEALPNG